MEPIHEFIYWGYQAKVYTGYDGEDFMRGLKTIIVEWRKGRRKWCSFMKYSPQMEMDFVLAEAKENFMFGIRQHYKKLFSAIRNLKGDRHRGRRSIHKRRFHA